ncbi:MAG: nucleoside/nucleotide kinase family protein [Thermincolia bacterium]
MRDEGRIVVAGVCGAGKSTLVQGLKKMGYDAHTVAQEHSYVPKMWQMSNPDLLIYLDAELETVCSRRKVQWGEDRLVEQRRRLAHAREHNDLYVDTNSLAIEEVLDYTLNFLRGRA